MGVKGREAYANCVTREDFMILTDEDKYGPQAHFLQVRHLSWPPYLKTALLPQVPYSATNNHVIFSHSTISNPTVYYIFYFYLSPLERQLQVRDSVFRSMLYPQCLCHVPKVLNSEQSREERKEQAFQLSNHMMCYMKGKAGEQGEWKEKVKRIGRYWMSS